MSATISSEVYLPDGVTVARGATVTATLLGGWVADGDGTIRMIPQPFTVGEDGVATAVLEPGFYEFSLVSAWADRTRVETTYEVTDGATLTWGEVFGNPTIPPLTPSLVSQATEARDEAEAAQLAAEAARDAAVDISNISTSDDVVEALVKNTGGAGPKTSAALSAAIEAPIRALSLPGTSVSGVQESLTSHLPTNYFDGALWGFGRTAADDLYRSTDDGTTWTKYCDGPGNGVRLLPCADGEVLWAMRTSIYRSSGFESGTPTWTLVYDLPGGTGNSITGMNFDGDGTKFIVGEYGSDRANANHIAISLDGGATWVVKYDTETEFPSSYQLSHLHGCCYDPWEDRFWFIDGHNTFESTYDPAGPMGIRWSDDDGDTWHLLPAPDYLPPGYIDDWTPTTMLATDDGIVMCSDSRENGVQVIRRTDDPDDMKLEWIFRFNPLDQPLALFGEFIFRDPTTGLVYLSTSQRDALDPPMVFVSDGITASIAYQMESGVTALNDRIRTVVVTPTGRIHMQTIIGATTSVRRGIVGPPGAPIPQDTGALLGGTTTDADRDFTAAGVKSVAAHRGAAFGRAATTTGSTGTAVGWQATAAGDNSTAVGGSASTGASSASAFGQAASASATNSTAIGKGSTGSGSSSTTVGGSSVASALNSTALGQGATATSNNSTALGRGTTTTTTNQTAIGPRHLEMGEVAAEPNNFAGDAARLYAFDVAGVTELRAKFNSNQIVRVATGLGVGSVPAMATASRPAAATAGAGAVIFDTTLGKPTWSDGTNWVDATGATV